MPSIDKCAGDGCICKTLNKRMTRSIQPRAIIGGKIQNISLDRGMVTFGPGSLFPVPQPQMLSREEITARVHREQQIYMEAKYGRR